MKRPKVVVIGGGTGTFTVLSGLKHYPVELSAVVAMSDSGGSTGRLRDQLGVLPPGDLRQALVALSESEALWRKLFTYRFETGDLTGHSFGNIFLSTLEKITGSTELALKLATKVLKTKGTVIPVTTQHTTLCAKYADGSLLMGESLIDSADEPRPRIKFVYLEPNAEVNKKAANKIKSADYLVLGPGDLYTSTIPNLLVDGVLAAMAESSAKVIYVMNLMTKVGQTDNFTCSTYLKELRKYIGDIKLDYVVVNNKYPDKKITDWYKLTAGAELVKDDLSRMKELNAKIVRGDFISKVKFEQSLADRVKRSLIRHAPEKLAKALINIIK